MLNQVVGANLIISLGALIGAVPFLVNSQKIRKGLIFLVSFSAGTLMSGALIHLIPEASEKLTIGTVMKLVILSFSGFLLLEKCLHWHHHHDPKKQKRKTKQVIGYMNMIGDLIHNFIDGMTIAATFSVSEELGLATTLAIFMHEVPQELGDMGVLLHAGFSKRRAVIMNFLTALSAVGGGVLGLNFIGLSQNFVPYLLAIAGGGFIYISASDLVPEMKEETKLMHSLGSLVVFGLGVLMMVWLKGGE